eukprot:TRINITY_DN81264_c0_g1_i1.p1 TRINITY_DN81264_c0_g1~~TRINITY_DN81264_c0_g1_i1.p1  ORF type:complete len:208 (-),score=39.28 TRINITY_DN81264_c0_g1_i1:28-651(-)
MGQACKLLLLLLPSVWTSLATGEALPVASLAVDDECSNDAADGACALQALQLSADATRQAANASRSVLAGPRYSLLVNVWSKRCATVEGPGDKGDKVDIQDCGARVRRLQQFRLNEGKLQVLGENEYVLCVVPKGGGKHLELDECGAAGSGWKYEKSSWSSGGWLETPDGKLCLGITGYLGSKAGSAVVADRCSFWGLTDQKWDFRQ